MFFLFSSTWDSVSRFIKTYLYLLIGTNFTCALNIYWNVYSLVISTSFYPSTEWPHYTNFYCINRMTTAVIIHKGNRRAHYTLFVWVLLTAQCPSTATILFHVRKQTLNRPLETEFGTHACTRHTKYLNTQFLHNYNQCIISSDVISIVIILRVVRLRLVFLLRRKYALSSWRLTII